MISSSINVNLPMKLKHFLFNNTLSYLQYLVPVCHLTLTRKRQLHGIRNKGTVIKRLKTDIFHLQESLYSLFLFFFKFSSTLF